MAEYDSTFLQPPFLGPARAAYPALKQLARVTGQNGDGSWNAFIQQWDGAKFRDREPVYAVEPTGLSLGAGYFLGRIVADWLGKPLLALPNACCRAVGALSSSVSASSSSVSAAPAPSSSSPVASPSPSAASSVSPGAISPSPAASASPSSSPSVLGPPSSPAVPAVSSSSSSSPIGPPILTTCCSNSFPQTLHATLTDAGGCPKGNVGSIPLFYNAVDQKWEGTYQNQGSSFIDTINISFYCRSGGTTASDLRLDFAFPDGCTVGSTGLAPNSATCSPLSATWLLPLNSVCGCGVNGVVQVVVTI